MKKMITTCGPYSCRHRYNNITQRWLSISPAIVVVIALLVLQTFNNHYHRLRMGVHGIRIRKRFQLLFGSKNPCYVKQRTQPSAESCELITLPNNFCSQCNVGTDIRSDGSYVNCLYASDLQTRNGTINRQCLNMMDRYVEMNPCDTHRRDAVRKYRNIALSPSNPYTNNIFERLRITQSRQILDSFIYSLCESACDCIPQYNTSRTLRQMDVHRGNCQGHILHDVCRVYPNIKRIRAEYSNITITKSSSITANKDDVGNYKDDDGDGDDVSNLPAVCPLIEDWRRNNRGSWFDLTPTLIDDVSKQFVWHLMDATEIVTSSSSQLWDTCYYLESQQQRIVPL